MSLQNNRTNENFTVAVRIRPMLPKELIALESPDPNNTNFKSSEFLFKEQGTKRLVQVLGDNTLIFDPNNEKKINKSRYEHGVRRNKETKYTFDKVFGVSASQQQVFESTAKQLIPRVLDGFNATVFAYGATGCGKTYTITGTPQDPGIIYRTIKELYEAMELCKQEKLVHVTVSYLEVYNETIRDLLKPYSNNSNSAGPSMALDLREDESRVMVAGLSEHEPNNLEDIMDMLIRGNDNRTRAPTEANEVSSRSHAVLQIHVRQRPKATGTSGFFTSATLSIIDLAGSERASVTKNQGTRQREGANINRSLLALGNCINALCSGQLQHVPYRDSKLTRLLKFSLQGNCKVMMIANISPASIHYDETSNTLKYANRAKNIKTSVEQNLLQLDFHVTQYPKIIESLKSQVHELQTELSRYKISETNLQDNGTSLQAQLINAEVNSESSLVTEEVLKKMEQYYEKLREKEVKLIEQQHMIQKNEQRQQHLRSMIGKLDSLMFFDQLRALNVNLNQQVDDQDAHNVQLRHQCSILEEAASRARKNIKTVTNNESVIEKISQEHRMQISSAMANSELIIHNTKLMKKNILQSHQLTEAFEWQSLLLDQVLACYMGLLNIQDRSESISHLLLLQKTVLDGFVGVSENGTSSELSFGISYSSSNVAVDGAEDLASSIQETDFDTEMGEEEEEDLDVTLDASQFRDRLSHVAELDDDKKDMDQRMAQESQECLPAIPDAAILDILVSTPKASKVTNISATPSTIRKMELKCSVVNSSVITSKAPVGCDTGKVSAANITKESYASLMSISTPKRNKDFNKNPPDFQFDKPLDLSKLGSVAPNMIASPAVSRIQEEAKGQNGPSGLAMRNSPVKRTNRVHARRSMIPVFYNKSLLSDQDISQQHRLESQHATSGTFAKEHASLLKKKVLHNEDPKVLNSVVGTGHYSKINQCLNDTQKRFDEVNKGNYTKENEQPPKTGFETPNKKTRGREQQGSSTISSYDTSKSSASVRRSTRIRSRTTSIEPMSDVMSDMLDRVLEVNEGEYETENLPELKKTISTKRSVLNMNASSNDDRITKIQSGQQSINRKKTKTRK